MKVTQLVSAPLRSLSLHWGELVMYAALFSLFGFAIGWAFAYGQGCLWWAA